MSDDSRRSKIRRATTGALHGLSIGFIIAMLVTGFHVADALKAIFWGGLPLTALLAYLYAREKR